MCGVDLRDARDIDAGIGDVIAVGLLHEVQVLLGLGARGEVVTHVRIDLDLGDAEAADDGEGDKDPDHRLAVLEHSAK